MENCKKLDLEAACARDGEDHGSVFGIAVTVDLDGARMCSPTNERKVIEKGRGWRISAYLLNECRLSYSLCAENEDLDFLLFGFLWRCRLVQIEVGERIICATIGKSLVFFRGRILPSQDGF